LRAAQIGLLTRLLSIADVYDALVSARPYRSGLEPDAACRVMTEGAGTQFDEHALAVFVALRSSGAIDPIYRATDDATALANDVSAGRHLAREYA
jgi:HD-GYP domain-containing protein (c-di-GMP phosphodiesterase class II)